MTPRTRPARRDAAALLVLAVATTGGARAGTFPATLDLDAPSIDGAFDVDGADRTAALGDVDGDGIADFAVGDTVVFGRQDLFAAPPTGAVDGVRLRVTGTGVAPPASFEPIDHVRAAGDIDADGIDDFLVAAQASVDGTFSRGTLAWLVFGRPGGFGTDTLTLPELPSSQAVRITRSGAFGTSVSAAGDVDGDGIDDIAVGIADASEGQPGAGRAGAVFIVYGSPDIDAAPLDLATLDASRVATFAGTQVERVTGGPQSRQEVPGGGFGATLAGVGDVDSDGFDDVLVGEPSRGTTFSRRGRAVLVRGGPREDPTDRRVPFTDGAHPGGVAVDAAGDVDGDGIPDLLIGYPWVGGQRAGAGFVVLGDDDGIATDLSDLGALFDDPGVREFEGLGPAIGTGADVAGLGDVDGDGFDDVAFTAPSAQPPRFLPGGVFDGERNGEAYVFFGTAADPSLGSGLLQGRTGFRVLATGGDRITGVAGLGDVDGDGLADIAITFGGTDRVTVLRGRAGGTGDPFLPDAPDVSVERYSDTSLELFWPPSGAPFQSTVRYRVERDGRAIRELGAGRSLFQEGLDPMRSYRYTVIASNAFGERSSSVVVDAVRADPNAPDAPPAPNGLSGAAYSGTLLELFWQRVGTARGYRVFADGEPIGQTDGTSFLVQDLSPGDTRDYAVSAVGAGGESAISSPITLTTPGGASGGVGGTGDADGRPRPPGGVRGEVYSSSALELFWERGDGVVERYRVLADGETIGDTNGTSFFVDGLAPGTARDYRIVAVDGAGESAPSEAVALRTRR